MATKAFMVSNDGKHWTPLINIDTAILLADEIKGLVFLENDKGGFDLVYSYGESALLARSKHTT